MDDKNFIEIKNGLINFIGAAINAVPLENKEARQYIFAMLIEIALDLATNENKEMDLYTIKPILRSTINILNGRIKKLKELPSKISQQNILEYQQTINTIQNFINNIEQ